MAQPPRLWALLGSQQEKKYPWSDFDNSITRLPNYSVTRFFRGLFSDPSYRCAGQTKMLQSRPIQKGGFMEPSLHFLPGDVAPRSGIYRVHHYAHRAPHNVIVIAGTILPPCKRCHDKVRFSSILTGESIESDVDLARSDFAA